MVALVVADRANTGIAVICPTVLVITFESADRTGFVSLSVMELLRALVGTFGTGVPVT